MGFELRHGIVTVRIAGYLAITSNTLQVGADAQLRAAGGGFRIEAALGFDALFETEPVFAFEIDFRVSASIRWRGRRLASVQVKGVLRGPGRWEVTGHASFSILFWDVDIDFELAWGEAAGGAARNGRGGRGARRRTGRPGQLGRRAARGRGRAGHAARRRRRPPGRSRLTRWAS